jgi:hypothetical protein
MFVTGSQFSLENVFVVGNSLRGSMPGLIVRSPNAAGAFFLGLDKRAVKEKSLLLAIHSGTAPFPV